MEKSNQIRKKDRKREGWMVRKSSVNSGHYIMLAALEGSAYILHGPILLRGAIIMKTHSAPFSEELTS